MMGKPAVTFTIPGSGVNYVNLNGTTGLEARNSDSKDLASKIEELFSDKEEYQRFAKQAQERSHSLFSHDVFAKHIQELYQNL
jgi:glycosyltransferase involved in cell wall biosynthesis